MNLSQKGIELIKVSEGCSLKVYADPVGIPTVGYGHVTKRPIGSKITQAQADAYLMQDLTIAVEGVKAMVKVPLTDDQFSAIVSLAFNVGVMAVAKSTLIKLVNQGKLKEAADEFPRWNKARGKVLPGLVVRRAAERSLFLG